MRSNQQRSHLGMTVSRLPKHLGPLPDQALFNVAPGPTLFMTAHCELKALLVPRGDIRSTHISTPLGGKSLANRDRLCALFVETSNGTRIRDNGPFLASTLPSCHGSHQHLRRTVFPSASKRPAPWGFDDDPKP